MPLLLSESEISFVRSSIHEHGIRLDGRSTKDYRTISLDTDVAGQPNGSARVSIGGTSVLVGCRLEIIDLRDDVEQTKIECHVEATPSALDCMIEGTATSLINHLRSLFSPLSHNPQLVILPGKKAWSLTLDCLILSGDGGNLYDTVTLACRIALEDLRIPRTRAAGVPKPQVVTGESLQGIASLVRGSKPSAASNFELESYWDEGDPLEDRSWLPVSVTLNVLNQVPFFDADLREELCTPTKFVFSFSSNGLICGVSQLGEGELEWSRIDSCVDDAAGVAIELHNVVRNHLSSRRQNPSKH